ncbi:MerR family transcriptional regulator [Thermoleophilum album]|uniref:DNA-binding transcriptional regulator, MerR family n=1 Tax=Thermoleophilum album TaxID=29539 RepID=A0A1H6FNE5_THEAL|nr:MerR family transcriptional regulator [Thermoleophilum album]SEH11373.1 DNA-binding transcriptional regulator, MerR family [Thermoleophilum album]
MRADPGTLIGIRTNAAAELLGVSPNTLRSWERRFGYPRPRRTPEGHRQYDLQELEALRRALVETGNISSAIEIARRRGEGPSNERRLLETLECFDEEGADRVLEESLAVRSVERTVEEVLLPALEALAARERREAELEAACRWATGWILAARRVVPPASRPQGVFLFDASERLDVEAIHVQALELAVRRAGFRTLLLRSEIAPDRLLRAIRALDPIAFVFCGGRTTLDRIGRLVHAVRKLGSSAPVLEYRDSMPVRGDRSLPTLGRTPTEAVEAPRVLAEGSSPSIKKAFTARRAAGAQTATDRPLADALLA